MKKELYLPYFKDKKVTVLGLGLLGRGVGDTKFLAEHGADVTVTDKKTQKELSVSLDALKEFSAIRFVLGEHKKEDFEDTDFILKAAGVAYDNEYVDHAKRQGIPVYMSASLVSEIVMKHIPSVTIIGVTGTRGKSTVTQMIAHILQSANSRVHVGGNIRGIANLPLLTEIDEDEYLLLELDSWQLQGFGEAKISPHIAVFTNFMDDHMNYYKNDKERYFSDKANIYRFQKKEDILIGSEQAKEEIQKRDKKVEVLVPEAKKFEMNLIGEHNQLAANLAYEAAVQCGIDDETIREAIKSFKAVDGRLEDMGEFKGVKVFNDNNATTPDATLKALSAIVETYNRKPILIMGGNDKGLPLEALEKSIQENTKAVVYLKGSGTERISLSKEHEFEKLEECVNKAFGLAEAGDIILFSPAFASFSRYFNNEYERNDEFVRIVQKYA
jgi:UDP-N-acetylmuramoylalanine--D-glutamate ligase